MHPFKFGDLKFRLKDRGRLFRALPEIKNRDGLRLLSGGQGTEEAARRLNRTRAGNAVRHGYRSAGPGIGRGGPAVDLAVPLQADHGVIHVLICGNVLLLQAVFRLLLRFGGGLLRRGGGGTFRLAARRRGLLRLRRLRRRRRQGVRTGLPGCLAGRSLILRFRRNLAGQRRRGGTLRRGGFRPGTLQGRFRRNDRGAGKLPEKNRTGKNHKQACGGSRSRQVPPDTDYRDALPVGQPGKQVFRFQRRRNL